MTAIDFVPVPARTDETDATRSFMQPVPHKPNSAGFERNDWERNYARILVVWDLICGVAAAIAALVLRFGPTAGQSYNRDYHWLSGALPFAWLLALAINRAFETRYLFVGNDEYERVFRSGVGLTASVAVVSFAFDLRLARGYVLLASPLVTVVSLVGRYTLRHWLHRCWARGSRLRRVILVGHEDAVWETTRRLRRERFHGMGVVGVCLPPHVVRAATVPLRGDPARPPVCGSFDEVAQAVTRAHADTVIVLSCPELDGAALRRLAWRLERDDIDLIVASTLMDVAGDRTTIRPVDGLPLLHVEHPRLKGAARAFKTVFDAAAAGVLLALLSPFMVVLVALIRLRGGRGPAIFRQVRVGRGGQPFVIYKFRTMYLDAETRLRDLRHLNDHDGALFKMRSDPRITPVGRWLRRLSLDELPQLVNVLRGDMSLVGPRPPLPAEVDEYPFDMRRRLVVKPGLTGLWQVSGRSDLSWEESIRLDLRYVENWSFSMDLMILARTTIAVLKSAGAY